MQYLSSKRQLAALHFFSHPISFLTQKMEKKFTKFVIENFKKTMRILSDHPPPFFATLIHLFCPFSSHLWSDWKREVIMQETEEGER